MVPGKIPICALSCSVNLECVVDAGCVPMVLLSPKLDDIKIDSLNEEAGDRSQNSKQIGSWVPFVKINNIIIRDINIDSFSLNLSGCRFKNRSISA